MIFTERSKMLHYLKKVISSKYQYTFRVDRLGELIVNNSMNNFNYLAYVNGQWYGAKGNQRITSENIFEKGKTLFALSDTKFWMKRNDGSVEYSSEKMELSDDVFACMFVEMGFGIIMFVVDGSKHPVPLMTTLHPDPDASKLAAMIIIALVRSYDPDGAKAMEDFWFEKAKPLTEDKDALWYGVQLDEYEDEEVANTKFKKIKKEDDGQLPPWG